MLSKIWLNENEFAVMLYVIFYMKYNIRSLVLQDNIVRLHGVS